MASERRHRQVYSVSLLIVAFSVCMIVALFTLDSSASAGVTSATRTVGGNAPNVVSSLTSELNVRRSALSSNQINHAGNNAWDQGNRAAEVILRGMSDMVPDQVAMDVRRGISNAGVKIGRGWDDLKYWMFH